MTCASTFAKLLPIRLLLSVIALPHRYYVPDLAARRPDHHHHPAPEKSSCLKSRLAIICALVFDCVSAPGKHQPDILEIKLTIAEGLLALIRIVADLHSICTPIMRKSRILGANKPLCVKPQER